MAEQGRRPMPERSRYDGVAQALRKNLDAGGVLLLVLNGNRGSGCVSTVRNGHLDQWRALVPKMLRMLADDIDRGETPAEVHTDAEREGRC